MEEEIRRIEKIGFFNRGEGKGERIDQKKRGGEEKKRRV